MDTEFKGKHEVETPLRRPRLRWGDNMGLREVGCDLGDDRSC